MRWSSKLLALAATSALGTTALETSIFTFHPDSAAHHESTTKTVSEDTARAILELRMGESVHSKLGNLNPEDVDRLNQYADSQFALFGAEEAPVRSVVFLEGLDGDIASTLRSSYDSVFVPHSSEELVELDSGMAGTHCSASEKSIRECLANNPILSYGQGLFDKDLDLVQSVDTFVSKDSKLTTARVVLDKNQKNLIKSLKSTFTALSQTAKSSNTEITLITLPLGSAQKKKTTDSDSPRVRRAVQQQRSSLSSSSSSSSSSDLLHSNLAPVCHATNTSCTESTSNCSGHGTCYLKFGSGNSDASDNCFACKCTPTTVKNKDGSVKKIQWGGVACQKEDISSPFFLIFGVTLLVVLLAGSAVGMLFGMGSQPLPSVIGAGVGNAKQQS